MSGGNRDWGSGVSYLTLGYIQSDRTWEHTGIWVPHGAVVLPACMLGKKTNTGKDFIPFGKLESLKSNENSPFESLLSSSFS